MAKIKQVALFEEIKHPRARRTQRRNLDAYYSMSWAADKLRDRLALKFNAFIAGTIMEPCVGLGALSKPFSDANYNASLDLSLYHVITNDLNPSIAADYHDDARERRAWKRWQADIGPIDWTITNPPFAYAPDILQHAYNNSRVGVAFLLRLSILEPCEDRASFMSECPPTHQIVLPRISFTGDGGTDNVTCAWFVWVKGRVGTIDIVKKEEIAPERPMELFTS
jgi:hypothetical protein